MQLNQINKRTICSVVKYNNAVDNHNMIRNFDRRRAVEVISFESALSAAVSNREAMRENKLTGVESFFS